MKAEAALDGVFTLRTREDAEGLRGRLRASPRQVLVIGSGFTGSEVASVCTELGISVTVAEAGPYPLYAALGGVIGRVSAEIMRKHGVDLRTNTRVKSLPACSTHFRARAGRTLSMTSATRSRSQ